jgi:hypothetical protein
LFAGTERERDSFAPLLAFDFFCVVLRGGGEELSPGLGDVISLGEDEVFLTSFLTSYNNLILFLSIVHLNTMKIKLSVKESHRISGRRRI